MRISQGVSGTREQRKKVEGNKGTRNSFGDHRKKLLRKGGQTEIKSDVKGTYLETFSLHHVVNVFFIIVILFARIFGGR